MLLLVVVDHLCAYSHHLFHALFLRLARHPSFLKVLFFSHNCVKYLQSYELSSSLSGGMFLFVLFCCLFCTQTSHCFSCSTLLLGDILCFLAHTELREIFSPIKSCLFSSQEPASRSPGKMNPRITKKKKTSLKLSLDSRGLSSVPSRFIYFPFHVRNLVSSWQLALLCPDQLFH